MKKNLYHFIYRLNIYGLHLYHLYHLYHFHFELENYVKNYVDLKKILIFMINDGY